MASNPPSKRPTSSQIAAACGAAAIACITLTTHSEGYLPKAKPDPAGIMTGCYGERVDLSNLDPDKVYSQSECAARLRHRLAQEYAPVVAHCMSELVTYHKINVFGALLDGSYNAGAGAVCSSPMAAEVHRLNWMAACSALPGWRITAKGQVYPGLVTRRKKEAALCRKEDVHAPQATTHPVVQQPAVPQQLPSARRQPPIEQRGFWQRAGDWIRAHLL